MSVLKTDKRVVDFCGDDLKPGWFITEKKEIGDGNSIKYKLSVKGNSGRLNTLIIGDCIEHSSLEYFNNEVLDHEKKLGTEGYDAEEFVANWPLDLEEYTILDPKTKLKIEENFENEDLRAADILKDEKIWRIKSLRVSVDEDTKILLLPLPKSKRTKELVETRYNFSKYGDLIPYVKESSETVPADYKRFQDKTEEEVQDEANRKRRM